MISKETKAQVIKANQRKEGDTGSPEVQIAILTQRIVEITEHMKKNPNDKHSRRGLIKLVRNRTKLLKYLEKVDLEGCRALKEKLGIRN